METKIHVNPETGRVGKCTANIRDCEFGERNHFEKASDAVQRAEEIIEANVNGGKDSYTKGLSKRPTAVVDVDEVDLEEIKSRSLPSERDFAEKYLRGSTVSEIRNNFVNDYKKVEYAEDLNKVFNDKYSNVTPGVNRNVLVYENEDNNYEPTSVISYSHSKETSAFDPLDTGREFIESETSESYDYDYDEESGDEVEVVFNQTNDYYKLNDAEKQEFKDYKIKKEMIKKYDLISADRLPDWVVLPKKSGSNTLIQDKVTDGDVSQIKNKLYALGDENKLSEQREFIVKERDAALADFTKDLENNSADINAVSRKYQGKITGFAKGLKNNQERLDKIKKVKEELKDIEAKNYKYKEEMFVSHLARYYPNEKKDGLVASQAWVDKNREKFTSASDFDILLPDRYSPDHNR